jgi:hypothetical protein
VDAPGAEAAANLRNAVDGADRAPGDMSTGELIDAYRHAWALASYRPRGYLSKALANWLTAARRELEARDAWTAEIIPRHDT